MSNSFILRLNKWTFSLESNLFTLTCLFMDSYIKPKLVSRIDKMSIKECTDEWVNGLVG